MKFLERYRGFQTNTKVVAKQTIYAFIIKGISLSISFFSMPAYIRYFDNNEILGVWFTILSIIFWFLNFDLGIGNGIRNHLVKAITLNQRDKAREIISSGVAWTMLITILITTIGYFILNFIDFNKLVNISPHVLSPQILDKTIYIVFAAIMIRFFLSSIHSILYALQKSSIINFLSLIVSSSLLLYVIVFRFNNSDDALLNIAYAYLIICNIPIILATIYVFTHHLKDCIPSKSYISRTASKQIMGIGVIFFLCQISYMILSNTNEFFISHYWNPLYTTDYSIYYRITMFISTIISLALTPTWSMITKAYQEGNIEWVGKLYRIFKIAGIIIVVCQLIFVPFQQLIINIWLGRNQLVVNTLYGICFACFGSCALYSTMLSTIVCGLGKMKLQLYCFGIGALLKIATICLIAPHTTQWIIVVIINSFILGIYCVLEQIRFNLLFRKPNIL